MLSTRMQFSGDVAFFVMLMRSMDLLIAQYLFDKSIPTVLAPVKCHKEVWCVLL
jgi:hypothetical protein